MKIIVFFISIFLFSNIFFMDAKANNFIQTKINGYNAKIIKYDLNSDKYELKFVKSDYDSISLKKLLKNNNAITGVNGIFFCPPDYSCNKDGVSYTNNERVIRGKEYFTYEDSGDRGMFGWTIDNEPFLYLKDMINPERKDDYYYGFANWPILLSKGKSMVNYYEDIGLIANNMRDKQTRNFVCSDYEQEHIYFGLVYKASMFDMPDILSELGCYDALNLDAGYSTSYMYNNRYLAGPTKRGIVDGLVIERKDLNVEELIEKGKLVTKEILKKSLNSNNKINRAKLKKIINQYIHALGAFRNKIYQNHSVDIYDYDLFGDAASKIGYEINIDDLSDLKKIYLINEINYNLELINKYLNK